jgi:hypothetical protein
LCSQYRYTHHDVSEHHPLQFKNDDDEGPCLRHCRELLNDERSPGGTGNESMDKKISFHSATAKMTTKAHLHKRKHDRHQF